jgi:hypothetical protein
MCRSTNSTPRNTIVLSPFQGASKDFKFDNFKKLILSLFQGELSIVELPYAAPWFVTTGNFDLVAIDAWIDALHGLARRPGLTDSGVLHNAPELFGDRQARHVGQG